MDGNDIWYVTEWNVQNGTKIYILDSHISYHHYHHMCLLIPLLALQSPVVDMFWIQQRNSTEKPQARTMPSIGQSLPAKQTLTKDERSAALMSSMQVLAGFASMSISGFERVSTEINVMIERESSITKKGDEVKQAEGVGANNIGFAPVNEYISNPPVKKKQSQARKQPHAIGAPTTSSYKAAGNRSQRERKETEKVANAKALGLM